MGNEIFNGFWDRLKSFVSNVQVGDAMSEEEKQMILRVCEQQSSPLSAKQGGIVQEDDWDEIVSWIATFTSSTKMEAFRLCEKLRELYQLLPIKKK